MWAIQRQWLFILGKELYMEYSNGFVGLRVWLLLGVRKMTFKELNFSFLLFIERKRSSVRRWLCLSA